MSSNSGRYAYIDVLRGLAALMVVYQHTAETVWKPAGISVNALESNIIRFFIHTISIGELGVYVFLMISGFVVPFSLLKYKTHPVKTFLVHRFFRLYPVYWLSIPLGLVFVWWSFGSGQSIDWLTLGANMTMFQAFFGVKNIMGQYWSLALELLFYIACLVLFVTGRLDSVRSMFAVLLGIILVREAARHLPISDYSFWVLSTFRYLGYMFFGLLYRKWLLEQDAKAGWNATLMFALTFLIVGNGRDIIHAIGGDLGSLKAPMTQLGALIIFVAFTVGYRPSNRIGRFLGEISYSLYLFHPVVFYPLYAYWFKHSAMQAHPHVFIALSMAIVIPMAYLAYRFVEKPFIDMGRKLFPASRESTADHHIRVAAATMS